MDSDELTRARWSPTVVAGGHALWAHTGSAVVLFGLGPPRRTRPTPGERAAELMAALPHRLTALRWAEQIHSAILASLSADANHPIDGVACVGRADGLLTADSGVGLLVWTADCVPVVVVGAASLAVVHAGWRGCAQDILGVAIRRLELEFGEPAAKLQIYLGPSIGACHYEVGDEVVEALAMRAPVGPALRGDRHLDLREFLRQRAILAGVTDAAIHRVGGCTACDPMLASFRRDGAAAGRQWSVAYLSAGAARRPFS